MDTDNSTFKDKQNAVEAEKNTDKADVSANGKMLQLNSLKSEKKLWEFKKYHESQIDMVRKSMHQAMSPISAISGYLDLIKMFLKKDAKGEKIEKYRSKIEEGINELEMIIEDLYESFEEKESNKSEDTNTNSTRRAS